MAHLEEMYNLVVKLYSRMEFIFIIFSIMVYYRILNIVP